MPKINSPEGMSEIRNENKREKEKNARKKNCVQIRKVHKWAERVSETCRSGE